MTGKGPEKVRKEEMMRSPHRNWHIPTLFAMLAISLSLLFVAGCTSNAVAPDDNLIQSKLDWMNEFFSPGGAQRGPGLRGLPILYDTVVTVWVDKPSVQFKVENGVEKIEFIVPQDALTSPLLLTVHVTKYKTPFGSFWLLDCGPEGTVFDKPLEVIPTQEVTEGNSPVLFYFNPTTGLWEVEQTTASGSSDLLINHFSKYGIS